MIEIPPQFVFIFNCTDPLMWYREKVGESVKLVVSAYYDAKFFWSKEDDQYWNLIEKSDAILLADSKIANDAEHSKAIEFIKKTMEAGELEEESKEFKTFYHLASLVANYEEIRWP